jgi:hypothetical protein
MDLFLFIFIPSPFQLSKCNNDTDFMNSFVIKMSEVFFFFFFRYTKPQTFADCIGTELPLGWEEGYDPHIGVYYIDHVNRK